LNHWVDVIEGKAQIKVSAHDCIQAARITAAAQAARVNQLNSSTVTPIPKHEGICKFPPWDPKSRFILFWVYLEELICKA
jgi:hypothetical protein